VHDIVPFGIDIAVASLALLLAVLSNRLGEWLSIPAPAFFLVAAAVASNLDRHLGSLRIRDDQRIVTLALVVILFDGGMHIGWRRFRESAGAIAWIGVAGTAVTAAGMALAAHWMFAFSWHSSLLLGTAIAPTDPAVVFSVLGRREIVGRTGTILEGESGANDPVAIAIMVSLLGVSGRGFGPVLHGTEEFLLQMVVGGVIGVLGGLVLRQMLLRLTLPNPALYPVQAIAFAFLVYGLATAARGSGFLAVFICGIVVGDVRAPFKRDTERFAAALSSLAEIVAFTVLGLTINLTYVLHHDLWVGLALAVVLILLARPVLVGLVSWPVRVNLGERAFLLLAGLKGAVPIALGTFILTSGVSDANRIYGVVFIVVLVSVVVQGGSVPTLAKLLHVPLHEIEPEPWSLGIRFQHQPEGVHRFTIDAGSPADGRPVADLELGSAWVSLVRRDGRLLTLTPDTVLHAGDDIVLLADASTGLESKFRT
jgi:cell volume regulation protein A